MKQRNLLVFFCLSYLISWLIWLPMYLPYFGINSLKPLSYNHALGGLGPMIAAFIMYGMENGKAGIFSLLRSMFRIKVKLWTLLFAIFGPFLLLLIACFISYLQSGKIPDISKIGLSNEYPQFSIIGYAFFNLIFFGFGEETGWRGYALPKLQQKYNAFVASVLLTVGWALWHLPLFLYRPGYLQMDTAGIIGWIFSLLTGSILLTWLFNSSRGNILVCAILHATIDIAFVSDTSTPEIVNYLGMLITFLGIAVLIFAKPKNLSKSERVTSLEAASIE